MQHFRFNSVNSKNELLFLGVESKSVDTPAEYTLRIDRLDLNNVWHGPDDDDRARNIFKLGGDV